jgi:hypothetical protein
MKKFFIIISFILTIGMIASCGTSRVQELTGCITFASGDVLLNGKQCEFGSPVKAGDTISTGAKSTAVVQFGESSIISLKENSSFIVDSLAVSKDIDTITINQKIGSSFNKIVKKGTKYSLMTPTSVAAVRGTSFMCSVSEKGSTIKLSSGRVKVIPIIEGELKETASVEIEAGKKIEATEKSIEAPVELTKKEQSELAALDKIELIPNAQKENFIEEIKKLPEAERPVVVPVEIIPVLEVSETDDQQKKPITLKDIERLYGTLSVVETTDGKVYTGAFSQEGNIMKVYTTEGTITIPSSKIASVSRYRGQSK